VVKRLVNYEDCNQKAATKRCHVFVSASRSMPIEVTIMHNEKNLGTKTYDRRSK